MSVVIDRVSVTPDMFSFENDMVQISVYGLMTLQQAEKAELVNAYEEMLDESSKDYLEVVSGVALVQVIPLLNEDAPVLYFYVARARKKYGPDDVRFLNVFFEDFRYHDLDALDGKNLLSLSFEEYEFHEIEEGIRSIARSIGRLLPLLTVQEIRAIKSRKEFIHNRVS